MPKWTEYTSKDTLADNDEVMLYDATAKANKRGLMSKFWDYVVDKMATAVISKLETNNKTIIGAINALNSDMFSKTISTQVNTSYDFILTNNRFVFVYFCAGNSTRASYCLYMITNFSTKDNNCLKIILDGNQSDDGFKIKEVSYGNGKLTVTTSIYGGTLKIVSF